VPNAAAPAAPFEAQAKQVGLEADL
jgi:hypothetical protein